MARHFVFMDRLEKLTIKKDSTLLFALALQEKGNDVFLLFEEDFHFCNKGPNEYLVHTFTGTLKENSSYISEFKTTEVLTENIGSGDYLHIRIDPPFDIRYLSYMWMLKALENHGVRILNSPFGVLLNNEKLYALEQESSLDSFVGNQISGLKSYLNKVTEAGITHLIMKPLDMFQGIGVEEVDLAKIDMKVLESKFLDKVKEYQGPVIVQPFYEKIYDGEVRSIYFDGLEIGSILKVPPQNDFLANVARGASFTRHELTASQRKSCERICSELKAQGVRWVAFDLLGDMVSEVNITCPGLLVEVSEAYGENLANKIISCLV